MSNRVRLVIGVAIVAVGFVVMWNTRHDRSGAATRGSAATPFPEPAWSGAVPPPPKELLPSPSPSPDAEGSTLTAPIPAAPLTVAEGDILAEIEDVQLIVRDFRLALGGNPIGSNAEIVKQIRGDNLKQLKLQFPASNTINAEGELCDRWGTPLFFHQVSRDKMEIRSAGPDRKMWTSDDRER